MDQKIYKKHDNPHLVKVSCYKISFHNFCRIPIKFCSYSSRILRSFVLPIRKVELDASRWRWFSEQKKQVTAEFVKSMSRILVIKSIHDFLPNWMIFFQSLNHVDMNLKPQFLIKSGYHGSLYLDRHCNLHLDRQFAT